MSVPKKRRTKGSKGKRRSHHSLKLIQLNKCPQCGEAKKPHEVCPSCGFYKGREIIKIEIKKKREKPQVQQTQEEKTPKQEEVPEKVAAPVQEKK